MTNLESYREGFDDGLERAIYELTELLPAIMTLAITLLEEQIYSTNYGHGYKDVKTIKEEKEGENNEEANYNPALK